MCQYANWLRYANMPHGNWHIGILAHYHNYEKNFKDTLDGYLADCSGSRLFLGV